MAANIIALATRQLLLAAAMTGALVTNLANAAPDAAQPAVAGDVPMADYLALLSQISPAAYQAAQVYLQAFERRCRRKLSSASLRSALAEGGGEPVLMAMIRASHLQDGPALDGLKQQVPCERRGRP